MDMDIKEYILEKGDELFRNVNVAKSFNVYVWWNNIKISKEEFSELLYKEMINIELMCLENKEFKYIFSIENLKKCIIDEYKENFMNYIPYDEIINKLNILFKKVYMYCSICGDYLKNNLYPSQNNHIHRKKNLGNICGRHIPSYALWDEDDIYEYDIYDEDEIYDDEIYDEEIDKNESYFDEGNEECF